MNLIGLDIGTTSICGVLMDAATGRVVKALNKPNASNLRSPHDWEFTQDVSSILSAVREIVSELREAAPDIRAIGVTGQMHGILYVDDNGDPVSPLFTWQDQRGNLPADGELTYAERLRRLTGYAVSTGFGMVTHYYHVVNGSVPQGAASLCTIADYAASKLAGRTKPVTDPTNAASLGVYRLDALAYDEEALSKAGIDPGILPEQAGSGQIIGYTADGIPVASAIGDNQASFLGSVRDIAKTLLVNIGTGSQISVYSEQYIQAEEIDTRPFPGGGYLLVGASLSGGKSYALLERFFREVCDTFAGNHGSTDLFDIMNRLADPKDADESGLKVGTQFYGTRTDPDVRGSIEGIGPANFTPRNLVLGFLEGMIRELRRYYDGFPVSVKERLASMVASGNGIRRNEALRSMLERRFGFPLEMPQYPEEAACGAAVSAGVGCGLYTDYSRRLNEWEEGRSR